MDWQQIIVWIVGVAVGLLLIKRVVDIVFRHRRITCGKCTADCPMKTNGKHRRRNEPHQ